MYFLLRLLQLLFRITPFGTVFIVVTTIFGGCSLMIALHHPYKKAYMNIIDVLI